jgi:hypothetical protein
MIGASFMASFVLMMRQRGCSSGGHRWWQRRRFGGVSPGAGPAYGRFVAQFGRADRADDETRA